MTGTVPHSALRDIVWPAVADGGVARQLALQHQFRHTERWSSDRLRAHQFAQLRHMLTHADRTMPFWRARLRGVGIDSNTLLTADC